MKLERPVDAKGLANLILDWADSAKIPVSPMKLQKLVYYCHADFLLSTGGPLIAQEFEAWEYGPVVPSLFQEFKDCGAGPILKRSSRFNPITAQKEVASRPELGSLEPIVKNSFELYCRFTASTLSRLSHVTEGPWSEALDAFRRGRNMGRRISNELICTHHKPVWTDSVH